MLFTTVRVILGLLGTWMALGFLAAIVLAADSEWGLALSATLSAIIGLWLVRVGINGTFSGNPRPPVSSPLSNEELKLAATPSSLVE